MGRIITTSVDSLCPVQIHINRSSIDSLLRLYEQNKFSNLFPSIGVKLESDLYAVINGTNRNIINSILGLNSKLYIPENEIDFLPNGYCGYPNEFIDDANNTIKYSFSKVYHFLELAKLNNIKNFDDLKESYNLHSLSDLKKFIGRYDGVSSIFARLFR